MDVSKNGGGFPQSSILIGFSLINHPFWGTTFVGNTSKMFMDVSKNRGCQNPPKMDGLFHGSNPFWGSKCWFSRVYMGVSNNSGTPKWMVYFMVQTLLKWMIWFFFPPYFWFNIHISSLHVSISILDVSQGKLGEATGEVGMTDG